MRRNMISRRKFLSASAMAAGGVTIASGGLANTLPGAVTESAAREVWIATVSQMDMAAETPALMVERIFEVLREALVFKPDIICLPELFNTSNIKRKYTFKEEVAFSAETLKQFAAFAKTNNCYVICPVYTEEAGSVYNSAVVFDRQGKRLGEYRKAHIVEDEVSFGLTPGTLSPPVFKTDFGIIGIQICFDILWEDCWRKLRESGAEIVFWPSAFAGGQMVNTRAWQNRYHVVSSTRKDTSKICDMSGMEIAKTGIWNRNLVCAPINLEKAFVHVWPHVFQFEKIKEKYGRKIRITIFHEEEWAIIESLSPEVKVKDVLKEFNIRTFEQHVQDSEVAQIKARKQ
ncbi:carbon-nitrogen hydrolase family protein [Chitinophaga niabensis]|uniref:Tat (Twin-arginine translocation) pathway signal sequence n=1 Tax=Chitinophaga niabensis TaxID=536979 RepID=A0A1N6J1L1_9BACT|nr:carbon-nitrogen hydrolase family protein [Chitinophaga niabensis]SIO38125.1 Tat (twin-arginine translocation) pathway signal sequence [Chitinophaga niabensis]